MSLIVTVNIFLPPFTTDQTHKKFKNYICILYVSSHEFKSIQNSSWYPLITSHHLYKIRKFQGSRTWLILMKHQWIEYL